jgi:isochorismate synthase
MSIELWRSSVASIEQFVLASVREFARGRADCAAIRVPAPSVEPTLFLRNFPRAKRVFWASPADGPVAGGGVATEIALTGPSRHEQLRAGLRALWAGMVRYDHPEAHAAAPRVYGGLAFHPGLTGSLWREFGDGCFTVPRWSYEIRDGRGVLGLALRREELRAQGASSAIERELASILASFGVPFSADGSGVAGRSDDSGTFAIRQIDFGCWERHIRKVQEAIASGRFEKIVAARRCDIDSPCHVDDVEVVGRLALEPGCTRFLFGRDDYSFLGATPETLFHKRGVRLETQALAGTRRLAADEVHGGRDPASFLQSAKDRAEHEYVVREIERALRPLCVSIAAASVPELRRVRDILHLNTPFEAHLAPHADAIALLEALHPTPAVGGAPTAEAAEWIARHEHDARGWYAGPVGWIDADGDARFAVAIRSGLIGSSRAHLFTGAGIVSGSHAQAEYIETGLKQLPLLRAIGCDSDAAAAAA